MVIADACSQRSDFMIALMSTKTLVPSAQYRSRHHTVQRGWTLAQGVKEGAKAVANEVELESGEQKIAFPLKVRSGVKLIVW